MAIQGIGLGLRGEFMTDLLGTERVIDWLEIIPENWLNVGGIRGRQFDQCAERWAMVPHSISMSIGGPDPLDVELFDAVTALCHRVHAPFWSDHICFSVAKDTQFNDLFPLPFSSEALDRVCQRVEEARRLTDVPLVFENPTYYVPMPGANMTEAEFFTQIFAHTGAGFLLDVNNVFVNAKNHGFDAEQFIDALPLEAVRQIHLAGHATFADAIIDTHGGPVADAVWALYRYTLKRAGRMIPTLIEWDSQIPPFAHVADEVDRARHEARVALAGADSSTLLSKSASNTEAA